VSKVRLSVNTKFKFVRYMNSKRFLIIVVFAFALGSLCLNSSTWFRLKLARFYEKRRSELDEMRVYKKIVRKGMVTNSRYKSKKVESTLLALIIKNINRDLKACDWYLKNNKGKIEDFEKGMDAYAKVEQVYVEYSPIFSKLSPAIWNGVGVKIKNNKFKFCILYAKYYIEKEEWVKAREFHTKELVKYYEPERLLISLADIFNLPNNSEIKKKIWGDEVYVSLNDLDIKEAPILNFWTGNTESKVNFHGLTDKESYRGNISENLKIVYTKAGYDYWAFFIDIPLGAQMGNVGLRTYLKGEDGFKGALVVNINYPLAKRSGVLRSDRVKVLNNNWQEAIITDIYKKAKSMADQMGWSIQDMYIDRVGIDTAGYSGNIYIDDFELFTI